MKSLVYVQFNSKLFNKIKRIKEENADVLVDGDEEHVEEWFVELDREGEEEEEELIDEDGDDHHLHIEFESEDEQV